MTTSKSTIEHSHNKGNEEDNDSYSSSSSEESSDEDLVSLVGRDDDDENSTSSEESDNNDKQPAATTSKRSIPQSNHNNKKKKKKNSIQVDFIFCDVEDKYFNGIQSLLNGSSSIYQAHSTNLTRLLIESSDIGTTVCVENDPENAVYGFASILPYSLSNLPDNDNTEKTMKWLASFLPKGTNKKKIGFFIHARMINLPLEIVLALHEQLVLDLAWANENDDGESKNNHNDKKDNDRMIDTMIRLAPVDASDSKLYHYFDDEILAQHAISVTTNVTIPNHHSKQQHVNVVVMNEKGHKQAIQELAKLVRGTL